MKISDNILYVGVNDKNIDLFEGQYKVPNGMSYNSYLIIDEKIADNTQYKFQALYVNENGKETPISNSEYTVSATNGVAVINDGVATISDLQTTNKAVKDLMMKSPSFAENSQVIRILQSNEAMIESKEMRIANFQRKKEEEAN